MTLMRVLGLVLLLQTYLWSFVPLHQSVADKPLMYLRLPILWDRDELSLAQKNQLSTNLLQALTKGGKAGAAQRKVLSRLNGAIEFLALPPENKFLPVPGLALRASFTGDQTEMSELVKTLVVAVIEEAKGESLDWLKFKRKVDKGVIRDEAFLLGRMTIITEKDQFTLYFSQVNPNFPDKFKAKATLNLESGHNSTEKDFSLFADIALSFSFYKEWLGSFAKPVLESLSQAGITDLNQLKLWTEGESESFELKGKVEMGKNVKGKWNQLSSAKKSKIQYPDTGNFKGSVLWPSLSASDWMSCFEVLTFIPARDRSNYAQLFEKVSGPITFSWREQSIAPIISIGLKDEKAFEASLAKMIANKGKIAKESGTNLRHIMWQENSVTYEINSKAKLLTFAPLLHALRDKSSSGAMKEQSNLIELDYPLAGNVSGNYYSLMHLVLQAVINSGASLDPKVFPSFNNLNVKDRSWSSKGSFTLKRTEQTLDMVWKQPFGLPGLVSGVKLPSSSWVYFLSLASLTSNSVKF